MEHVVSATCIVCGKKHSPTPDITTCTACGGMLDIKYDYDYIARHITKEALAASKDNTMWRYKEFLPIEKNSDTCGLRVGGSPLYHPKKLGDALGMLNLYIKDDGLNPTSSLKDRASAMALVKAAEAGADTIACSSTGNAASSLAGGAAARGVKTYIFVPKRAPQGKIAQLLVFGANVVCVDGNYEETFKLSAEAIERWGWYNRNAAINPYLMEGKKTVAHEIAEQLDWQVPDYVAVSVGDGCTIAGVWKGFWDLYSAGFTNKLPKLISVQASGCCPINNAIEAKSKTLVSMEENTIADSIAVGVPRNFLKAVNAVEASHGVTVNVSDEEILTAMRTLGKHAGVFGEPAGVAATAGLMKAVQTGAISKDASVVSIVTGNGLKDIQSAIKTVGMPTFVPPSMDGLVDYLTEQHLI